MNKSDKIKLKVNNILNENKKPPKSLLDKAVKLARLRIRAHTIKIKDAQRLEERFLSVIMKIADISGMSSENVWDQIMTKAEQLGGITPIPSRDI